MTTGIGSTSAATISILETVSLFDGPFRETADGVAHDQYALWLGSGISFERMPRLTAVLTMALDYLQSRIDQGDPQCRFRRCLWDVLGLANLQPAEVARIDLSIPAHSWAEIEQIAKRLLLQYARALDSVPDEEPPDFLLWTAIDVVAKYTDPSKTADAEHLTIAALIIEGVASNIASANWDVLIERAVNELGGTGAALLKVCVRAEDLRSVELRSTLYKFHGCAGLAGADPGKYRHKLVGRQSQINGWASRLENQVMAEALIGIATQKPTLMIGLSAQDANIQGLFVAAQVRMEWPWPSHPPAYVFSEDKLGPDQQGLLQNVYNSNYTAATRQSIYDSAVIRAYAKPMLVALLLSVLFRKWCALIGLVPQLQASDKAKLIEGIRTLRDSVAGSALGIPHEDFVRSAIDKAARAMSLFREGRIPMAGAPKYWPISSSPLQALPTDPAVPGSGLGELSIALGLLGLIKSIGIAAVRGHEESGDLKIGALSVETAGVHTNLFFASNTQSALHLFANGHVSETDDAVLVHSHLIVPAATRSPKASPGRTGIPALREVSIAELMSSFVGAEPLLQRFREVTAV